LDAVFVKDCGYRCNAGENRSEVADALTAFFELHRAAVVDIDDYIVEGKSAEIVTDFWRDAPTLTQSPDLGGGFLGQVIKNGGIGWIEDL